MNNPFAKPRTPAQWLLGSVRLIVCQVLAFALGLVATHLALPIFCSAHSY